MEFFKAIAGRRSIRDFSARSISTAQIRKLIKSASWAPSGVNAQPWYFIVIRGRKELDAVKEIILSTPGISPITASHGTFFNAPAVILCSVRMTREWYHAYDPSGRNTAEQVLDNPDLFSAAAAVENILLSAHASGLGSLWTKIASPYRKKLEKRFNVPDGYRLFAGVALGYPIRRPKAPKRKMMKDICSFFN